MRKRIFGLAVAIVILLAIFGFYACGNSHAIPNGKYVPADGNSYTLHRSDTPDNDYFWRIKGTTAIWYASNQKSSISRIVQENGKIYFESEDESKRIEVKYDDATKSFIFLQ